MFMVTKFLQKCAAAGIKSLDHDVTFMIVNVFLSRKRGEGGGQKVMRQDLRSGKR